MNLYDLLEYSQLKAIQAAISPSLESIWRMRCRDYSQKFFTPLHLVMALDPIFILQALYEDQFQPSIVEDELEELLDRLYIMKDPTYSRMSQQDTEDMVDMVLNKEIKRAANKKLTPENTSEILQDASKPKQGALDFSNLAKNTSEI